MRDCFNTALGNVLKNKSYFTGNDRVVISTKIGEYLVNNLIKATPAVFENVVEQLIDIFPHETDSQYLYYSKNEKNKPSGLLYVKYAKVYRNNKCILDSTLFEKNINTESDDIDDHNEDVDVDSENVEGALRWLERNRNPTRNQFHELKEHWTLTSFKRNPKFLVDVEQWPHYKLPIGYDLISIDFRYYNQFAAELNRNTTLDFINKLLPNMKSTINSAVYKKKCEDLLEIDNEGENA